jgi:hypothetical protein
MKEEEKIKIEIERLKTKREFIMFEYSNINSLWIGAVAFLIAIFIPLIILFAEEKKLGWMIVSAVVLLIVLYPTHKIMQKIFLKKKEEDIHLINQKIDKKYEELLK